MTNNFGERLTLALKALTMSRARLAAELGVDKSLVGRWASGAVRPSAHNLERLTRLLAGKLPELTLLDWEREPTEFAALLGINPPGPQSGQPSGLDVPAETLDAALASIRVRGAAYEGFWRATHPAIIAPGRFFHQHGMVRRDESGLLRAELGGPDVRYVGSMLPIDGQVFVAATDSVRHLPCYMIFNIVTMPKIVLMDGLLLTAGNAMRNPSAYPITMERIGDLSGDRDADDAHAAELMRLPQFVQDEALISQAMRDHLIRDFGPEAAKSGGDLLLTVSGSPDLAQLIAARSYGS
ncbi:helix-turn-helix domain-containing protein [Sphingomonas psychrotolerans]|nr:helix-turn-helix transcriptional regulator [Sphingomonas psychrotolerans]